MNAETFLVCTKQVASADLGVSSLRVDLELGMWQ